MTKQLFKSITLGMAAFLASSPSFAQLSLSGSADADVETSSDSDTDASTTAEEPTPATTPEPIAAEPVGMQMETVAPASDTPGIAGYDGGFFIKSADDTFKLKLNAAIKTRWDLYNDEWQVIGDNGNPGSNHTTHAQFSAPYARVGFSGNAFSPKYKYHIQYDFAAENLIYMYSQIAFIPNTIELTVGQFKRPYSRAYRTSTARRQFIDGPHADMANGGSATDVGLELSNNYTKVEGLEWAIGVFNGTQGINGDFSPVVVGRIGFNNGIKGYSETDFEGGGLRFGVGLSASTEFDHDDNEITSHYVQLDGMLKVAGLGASAGVYLEGIALDDPATADEEGKFVFSNNTMARIGAFLQGGYLINDTFEPMARFSMLHTKDIPDDLETRTTAGFSWHIVKNHRLKWENNITLITNREDNIDQTEPDPVSLQDILFTSQLQAAF